MTGAVVPDRESALAAQCPDVVPEAVVTASATPNGLVLRWYSSAAAARLGAETLSVSALGVKTAPGVYLTDVEPGWLASAVSAYDLLRLGRVDEVMRLVTGGEVLVAADRG